MMAAAALLILTMGVIAWFPDTPVARWLREALIVKPAELLADMSAKDAARLAVFLLLVIVLISAGPEIRVLAAAVGDMTLLFEILVALWMIGFVAPWRLARRLGLALSQRIAAVCSSVRSARARSRRRKSAPPPRRADDPDPGFAWAWA